MIRSILAIVLVFAMAGAVFAPPDPFKRGDVTTDGYLDITDAVTLANALLIGNANANIGALPCKNAADVDDTNCINMADVAYLLAYLFSGGPAPPAPGPITCGPDTTSGPPLGGMAPCILGGGVPNPAWICTYPTASCTW